MNENFYENSYTVCTNQFSPTFSVLRRGPWRTTHLLSGSRNNLAQGFRGWPLGRGTKPTAHTKVTKSFNVLESNQTFTCKGKSVLAWNQEDIKAFHCEYFLFPFINKYSLELFHQHQKFQNFEIYKYYLNLDYQAKLS